MSRDSTCATRRCRRSSPSWADRLGSIEKAMRLQPRILVVEDEASIAELIAVNLRHNGYQITWATDGKGAQRELDEHLPDLILLDWMLPGESGLLLAKRWRADPRPV